MAAARGVVEEKRLLAIFHLPDEIDTVVHPVLVEFFDIGKVDQLDVFALLRVAIAAGGIFDRRGIDAGWAWTA